MPHSYSAPNLLIILIGAWCFSVVPTLPANAQKTQEVFVIFDGPWAFAPDPNDATKIIALAPKAAYHRELFVQSHNTTLEPGVYELSFPLFTHLSGMPQMDPDILYTPIGANNVQHALNATFVRYAIRLPKPDAYLAETRFPSRIGPTYPPEPSTEWDYVSTISLRYRVSTLKQFVLTGSPDSGVFSPLFLRTASPTIQFVIDAEWSSNDICHTHERATFHTLATLLNLNLFIDFPGDPIKCQATDPQNPNLAADQSLGPPNLHHSGQLYDLVAHEQRPHLLRVGRGSNCRVGQIVGGH